MQCATVNAGDSRDAQKQREGESESRVSKKKKEIGIQNTLVSYTNGTSKLLPLFSSVARVSNLYYISPS